MLMLGKEKGFGPKKTHYRDLHHCKKMKKAVSAEITPEPTVKRHCDGFQCVRE